MMTRITPRLVLQSILLFFVSQQAAAFFNSLRGHCGKRRILRSSTTIHKASSFLLNPSNRERIFMQNMVLVTASKTDELQLANEDLQYESNADSGSEENFEKVRDPKFLERNKYWVVLVDDEESIRLAVGDYLYDQGYQVTACADADAFLEVCQQGLDPSSDLTTKIPDIIVSDVRMPGKDGIELLGLIRSDERLGRVPVVLLTAKAMTQDRIAGYKAGANVYLPKPFAPEELLSILDNSISRKKQMTREKGRLLELKQDMANIKEIMRRNGERVVQKTNVYLTLAEREVLELLCKGYTNKEIAKERGTNLINVNKMIQKLYMTTQTQTRTELVRWALKTGYVPKR